MIAVLRTLNDKIGFIGLGNMGRGMADNLLQKVKWGDIFEKKMSCNIYTYYERSKKGTKAIDVPIKVQTIDVHHIKKLILKILESIKGQINLQRKMQVISGEK